MTSITLEVYDVLGRKVESKSGPAIINEKINTSQWHNGNYYIVLKSDQQLLQKIVVVKH